LIELVMFARLNRAWWLLLIIPLLVVAVSAVSATHVIVPYTVYTLF
jgi:capsular polysaccharide biosynthesis protein